MSGEPSLKRAAWAFGCAAKGSQQERELLAQLLEVVRREICPRGCVDCGPTVTALVPKCGCPCHLIDCHLAKVLG